jgi:hypothetical protein
VYTATGICHAEILKVGKITGVYTCTLRLNRKTCGKNYKIQKKVKIVKIFQKMQQVLPI